MQIRLLMILFTSLLALEVSGQVIVGLRLDEMTPTGLEQSLFCDSNYECGLLPNENNKQEISNRLGMPISVQRDGKDFVLSFGTRRIHLLNGGSVIVRIRRQVAPGRFVDLPYEFTHSIEESKGRSVDDISFRAHYILRGAFNHRGCGMDIALNNIRADGKFDLSSADAGTNLQIDRNKDGKFWGRGEFERTSEVIEFCGRNYTVSDLSYSRVVFRPTSLRLARVGEKTEDFSLSLLTGTRVTSDSQRGRAYILDFWASWCAPCVANLPHIKQLRDETQARVDIFSIDVDKPSARKAALAIVEKNGLRPFTSIRGMGENDPIWRTFGGADQNHLHIPLYVLIDKDSVIRYSGNGGENLADLKTAIDKIAQP